MLSEAILASLLVSAMEPSSLDLSSPGVHDQVQDSSYLEIDVYSDQLSTEELERSSEGITGK